MREFSKNSMLKIVIGLISLVSQFSFANSRLVTAPSPRIQDHSWSNPGEQVINAMDLVLTIDMETKKLHGLVSYQISKGKREQKKSKYDLLYLDAKKINVLGVYTHSNRQKKLPFNSVANFRKSRKLVSDKGASPMWMFSDDIKQIQPVTSGVQEDNLDLFGEGLVILIGKNSRVAVEFEVGLSADALQWLTAEQTHDKQRPFLFSQSQAILARTWIPCQDLPSVRFTYSARVMVKSPYNAVMSAEKVGVEYARGLLSDVFVHPKKLTWKNAYTDFKRATNVLVSNWLDYPFDNTTTPADVSTSGDLLICYQFAQNRPIPSYLLAISVGDFRYSSYRVTDDKNTKETGVYAERGYLEECRREFVRLPELVKAAERLYGQYVWGSYRVLVLPPSFPFGGMENPVVTFATPTIVAGDGSLVSLLAHELAHSWSGNLVTNATWEEFWLNEGFTNYFESRIMESVFGKEYADLLVNLAYADLVKTVEEMEQDSQGRLDTRLVLELDNRDPDEGVTDIAYEKGRFLLVMIERNIGRDNWDLFLRSYFSRHSFGVVTTQDFLTELKRFLLKGVAYSISSNGFIPNENERNPVPSSVDSIQLSLPSVVFPAGELKDYWNLKVGFCTDFISAIEKLWIHGIGLPFEGIAAFPEIESAELLRVDGIASRYWSSGVDRLDRNKVVEQSALGKSVIEKGVEPSNKSSSAKESKQEIDLPEVMACEFHRGGSTRRRDVLELDTTNFTAQHWVHLLRRLRSMGQLSVNDMEAIDERFHLSERKNAEVAFEWYMLGLKCHYKAVFPYLEQFLFTVGRRKFVLPLYEQILKTQDNGLEMVSYIFYGASPGYHSVTRKSVTELLLQHGQ